MMDGRLKTTPAPVGGWNARDSLADMPATDAVILDNWFPSEGKVSLRPGYDEHATTLGGQVQTLAEFHDGTTQKFIAAANGNLWNITSAGAGVSLASGFTSNKWQWVQFDGKLGLVNGSDAPQVYNGSAVSAMTISGSGLTVTTLIGICSFKSRTYFWADNTQDFWYSAVNTLGGVLTKFPLSRVGTFGGKLVTMVNWTRDAGDGADDYAVFVMSSGEAIVYQGSDPGTTWSLVGIYRIGAPIGQRCAIRYAGDVVIITKDGYVSLAQVIGAGRTKESVSGKINPAVLAAANLHAATWGWQATFNPVGRYMIFNVPTGSNTYVQHVINTNTGAWCRFTGINANCWGMFNDKLYFGGNGAVYLFGDAYDDNGAAISADGLTAFQYLGQPSKLKQVTAVQLNLAAQAETDIGVGVRADFDEGVRPTVNLTEASDGEAWDVATWDVSTWSPAMATYNPWRSVSQVGRCLALRLAISSTGQPIYWFAHTYVFKEGGAI